MTYLLLAASVTLTPAASIFIYNNTGAAGAQSVPGRCRIEWEMTANDWFQQSQTGDHFGFMLRADPAGLPPNPANYSGHGVIFGNILNNGLNEAPLYTNCGLIETWGANTIVNPLYRFLFQKSASPALLDNIVYRGFCESLLVESGRRFTRYGVCVFNATRNSYDWVWDTGDVNDNNPFNTNHQDFALFMIASAGSVTFTNLSATWSANTLIMPDLTSPIPTQRDLR